MMEATEEDRAFVAYCQNLSQFRCFFRMRNGLAARGWILVVVTHVFSVWLNAHNSGISCFLLRSGKGAERRSALVPAEAIEWTGKPASTKSAVEFQAAIWSALSRTSQLFRVRAIGLWNGLTLAGQTAAAFAKAHSVCTVYFELGNIEPKLFVDPEGVNAASRVARLPELLNEWDITDGEVAKWKRDFIKRNQRVQSLPQARILRKVNAWFPVDWLGAKMLRIPQPYRTSLFKKILSKIDLGLFVKAPDIRPTVSYVFLPLQVSSDTNLLLFSDYNNLAAIAFAETRAAERSCRLVVKPHPAEPDFALLREITALCRQRNHLMTSYNTTELILGAEEVITINSTVGLEAILLDKKVTILGRSLYGAFSKRQAAAYVLRHLVDFDPFGSEQMSAEAVDRILSVVGAC